MALGDEQIDRLTRNLNQVMFDRIKQFDAILDDKIVQVQKLLNGIRVGVVANIDIPKVEKAQSVEQPQ